MSTLVEVVVPRRLGTSFRWLVGSSWTANTADGIAIAAGPLLVASQTDQPFLVALAALCVWAPPLLFGLYAGVLTDRLDRRLIVVTTDLVRVAVIGVLAAFVATDTVSVAVVLVALFALGTAEMFCDNAAGALLPMIVHRDDLAIGNSRLQTGFITVNQLAGPPLGALLFAAGAVWPLVAQAVLLALATVLVSRVVLPKVEREVESVAHASADGDRPAARRPGGVVARRRSNVVLAVLRATATPPTRRRGVAMRARGGGRGAISHDIAEGFRWVWHHAAVRTLALTIFIFNITFGAAWSVLVLYATDHLGLGEVGFGLVTTVGAVGGLAGTFSYGWITRRVSLGDLMRIGLVVETLTHLGLALTSSPVVALPIFFVFGAHAFIWGTTSTTVRQRAVPSALQGRVSAVYLVGVFGGLVAGSALGGVLAQHAGVTAPFWFAFAGSAVFVVLIWRQLSHIAHADEADQPLDATSGPAH